MPVVEGVQGSNFKAEVLATLHIAMGIQPLALGASFQSFCRPAVGRAGHHLDVHCQVECDFIGA